MKKVEKPSWLKVRWTGNKRYLEGQSLISQNKLHTVCQEANCPNRGECFASGTATFLIMGPNCTRNCRFCNIDHKKIEPLDSQEPARVAYAVKILNLKHAVITSVTRDDLDDGGASQFCSVIEAIRKLDINTSIEVLTPDFLGKRKDIETVLKSKPDVFNHNVETVPRLYKGVRPQGDYDRSLSVLKIASEYTDNVKSGLMVGLGEDMEEFEQVFNDLSLVGVRFLTIGQYLPPSDDHFPLKKYYHPDEFNILSEMAQNAGIPSVFSAPLVRSSYHAMKQFQSK